MLGKSLQCPCDQQPVSNVNVSVGEFTVICPSFTAEHACFLISLAVPFAFIAVAKDLLPGAVPPVGIAVLCVNPSPSDN